MDNMKKEIVERFLKYVSFDTQSSEEAEGRCPSTEKQLRLAEYLMEELKEIGMQEVEMDAHGYVFATLPASEGMEEVPVVGFIAHMDTSPDCSGADVKPRIIENYDGTDIVLDVAEGIVTRVSQFPELLEHKGEDLIVTDGHTLLGADDKAGIAEIMSAMAYLLAHPEEKHGKVRVCFNPDEEIGCGAHLFDVEKFGCQWAYTMDGSEVGELEYENFNAASAKIVVNGVSVHPGYAKDKMVNAALLATEFAQQMPENEVPERTTGYEGFFHLYQMQGGVEQATLTYIIRDHNTQMFQMRKRLILDMCERMNDKYGHGTFLPEVRDTYYNMHTQLVDKPHITEIALRAIEEACGFSKVVPIRGGTDGAQLSFKGLPCPNIFAGGLNFHGRHEFLPIQSMEKAMQTVVNICRIVSEKYA
ncbi:MAG: peptidase T [Bacteroidaceae bacterium]|nr:peptidase T [Bacteroidaceae bacterium]